MRARGARSATIKAAAAASCAHRAQGWPAGLRRHEVDRDDRSARCTVPLLYAAPGLCGALVVLGGAAIAGADDRALASRAIDARGGSRGGARRWPAANGAARRIRGPVVAALLHTAAGDRSRSCEPSRPCRRARRCSIGIARSLGRSPVDVHRPRADGMVTFTVKRAGFKDVTRDVMLDRDQMIELTLLGQTGEKLAACAARIRHRIARVSKTAAQPKEKQHTGSTICATRSSSRSSHL